MAKVIITNSLEERINRVFRGQAEEILSLLKTLEENPKKGKEVGHTGGIVIKELKYNKYRFYFITDGFKVRFFSIQELQDMIIKFVNMSEKKDQQKVIDEIKTLLLSLGMEGFD